MIRRAIQLPSRGGRRVAIGAGELAHRRASGRCSHAARWDLLGPQIDAGVAERLTGTAADDLDDTFLGYAILCFTFDFGELARLREAEAEERALRVEAQAVGEMARAEVLAALAELRIARDAIPVAEAGARAAAENRSAQLARYRAGATDGLAVLDAQRTYMRSRLDRDLVLLHYDALHLRLLAVVDRLSPGSAASAGAARLPSKGTNAVTC